MNMVLSKKLPSPEDIKQLLPTNEFAGRVFDTRNSHLKDIFDGKNHEFILIIGPCSADRKEPVMEYMSRLSEVNEQVKDKLFIIPRVYTAKPRTMGAGYMGMLHQPEPYLPADIAEGIMNIRSLFVDIACEFGFSCADEMLYPENYEYFSDLVGYVAVGARSVESHMYRVVASGLDVPVGMKNPTNGNIEALMNAVEEARRHHSFVYRTKEAHSAGNRYSHAVLRGYKDISGNYIPNYDYGTVMKVLSMYEERNIFPPSLIIDASHANSAKDYLRQADIARFVVDMKKRSDDVNGFVRGLMIESYLEDGCCVQGERTFGKSITDACLGWEKSRDLIYEIADKL